MFGEHVVAITKTVTTKLLEEQINIRGDHKEKGCLRIVSMSISKQRPRRPASEARRSGVDSRCKISSVLTNDH